MSEKSKRAWLITWELRSGDSNPPSRSRVVALLPSRTHEKVVAEVVRALFVAVYPLTLSEKVHFGLNAEQRRLCMSEATTEYFVYGSHDHLYARKVKNLRRSVLENGKEELRWTEYSRYKIDRETMLPVMIVAERDDSCTESGI
jgi:hypothetical protein